MIVTDEVVVYRNPYPAARSEQLSGTSLAGSDPMYCSFRLGSARMSPDGRVVVASSADSGRTWTTTGLAWRATDSPQTQVSGGQIGASGDGTVVLAAARMRMAVPGDPDWDAAAAGIVDADCAVMRRTPETDWTPVGVLDFRRHTEEWAIPCGPPLALGGGRWFMPVERHGKPYVSEWLRAYHAFGACSTDDGLTWRESAPMLNDPQRRAAYYDQHVTRIADDRLLSLAWVHDVVDDITLPARAGWSDDGGLTWSAPWDTGILGGPVAAVPLPDGRLFAVYPRRAAPAGIRACLSPDGGRTWDTATEFVIWDESVRRVVGRSAAHTPPPPRDPPLWNTMWAWTFGLPCPVANADGSVGVAFYATEPDGASTIRYVRITV